MGIFDNYGLMSIINDEKQNTIPSIDTPIEPLRILYGVRYHTKT